MNYTKENKNNQSKCENFLHIPSHLDGFTNTDTSKKTIADKECYCFNGFVSISENDRICPECGAYMHHHKVYNVSLKHLPFGGINTRICINSVELKCSKCGHTHMQNISFKDDKHFITKALKEYIRDLLATNNFTNKEISYLTGVNRNIVKEIDKERLIEKYTIDGLGKKLIKPEIYAKHLGIDEFKLHNGYKYATHIIDYDTGHILWIAEGKKKQVVYDFINHVGIEWMSHVEAVACDMNSDFEEAFKEKCPHIKIVYDHFHIVKNFNDKVIAAIRKDEQERLIKAGDEEAAKKLKKSKYILYSSTNTLNKKDEEVQNKKIISKGSQLFNKAEIKRHGNYYDRYEKLVNNNNLFLTIELIKDTLAEAYRVDSEDKMVELIFDVMELCEASNNKHLRWFGNLLYNHFDGIITHATIRISAGKIEGINNKTKTLRRQAYGYPDDEYFFLKLFDMSRN